MNKIFEYYQKNKKNIEVVLFDIFDTIFLRDVYPEYTKKLWAKRFLQVYNIDLSTEELYQIRYRLEAEICKKNGEEGNDIEFSYNQFLLCLHNELVSLCKFDVEFNDFCIMVKDIEVQVELSVQSVDTDWLNFVKILLQENVKVYCVSDFYFTKEMLLELFRLHGINKLIQDVFVSSEYLKTKRSGKLYDVVLENLGSDRSKILMIGDNSHSDYEVPKTKGLMAYLIDREAQMLFYEKSKQDSSYQYLLKKIQSVSNNELPERMLFNSVTYPLYAFIDKLYKELISNGIKDVFFLSREGEFLKNIFDYYQSEMRNTNKFKINSHYLYVSRKATFLPSLNALGKENFEILFRQYRKISIWDFLSSLGFDCEDIFSIASSIGCEKRINEKLNDFPTDEVYNKILQNDAFKYKYEKNRNEQKDNFKAYIDSFNINIKEKGLNLVDVGWKGTIQDNIFNIYDNNIVVRGYYLGLIATGLVNEKNLKKGVLFSNINFQSEYFSIYNENRAIFEIILGASHGSAEKYVNKNNSYIEVITKQEIDERKLFENVIHPIQNEIFILFKELCKCINNTQYNYDSYKHIFAKKYAKFVFLPSRRVLNFFGKIYHFENFGVFEYTTFCKKDDMSVGKRLRNFLELCKDRRRFLSSGFWGALTLYNSGLGFIRYVYGICKCINGLKRRAK